MLVAMTYSLELFACIVLGLIIGHAVFNMKQPVGESIDPCCAPSQNDETEKNKPMTQNGKILNISIPQYIQSYKGRRSTYDIYL